MKNKKAKFVVELTLPYPANGREARDYVESAVRIHCGCLDPNSDSMFDLDKSSVKVRQLIPKRRKKLAK